MIWIYFTRVNVGRTAQLHTNDIDIKKELYLFANE